MMSVSNVLRSVLPASWLNRAALAVALLFCVQGVSAGESVEPNKNDAPAKQDQLDARRAVRAEELLQGYQELAKPVLSEFCYDCHNQDYNEANVKLDILDPDMLHGPDAERWHAALDMVNSGAMPPEDGAQPSDQQRRAVVDWITESLDAARELRRGGEQPRLRRLTKRQYANTLRDLLKLPITFGDNLPDDSPSKLGFKNNSVSQLTTSLHFQQYQAAAREALSKAIVEGDRPQPFRVRVSLGQDLGAKGDAAHIAGYQSMPIDTNHILVEVLDETGQPRIASTDQEKAEIKKIKKNIGIGMRGSAGDRFRIAADGIVLDSALPHREVSPKSWQGPSPNLKLLLRRCAPNSGPFRFAVKASQAEFGDLLPVGLMSLRETEPLFHLQHLQQEPAQPKQAQPQPSQQNESPNAKPGGDRITVTAEEFGDFRNIERDGKVLSARDVTKNCQAKAKLVVEQAGLYQVELVHPIAPEAAMPSVTIRVNRTAEHVRLDDSEPVEGETLMVTPIAHAKLTRGEHTLGVGGKFFVGLRQVVFTRLPDDHPVVAELTSGSRRNSEKFADATPSLRVFLGSRTDDGMEYETFGDSTPVTARQGEAQTYEFVDYLENLPAPTYDELEQGSLSNIMIVGMWNNHLVKQRQDQGPPLRIEQIEFETPYHPSWPPASHQAILFDDPLRATDLDAYTRRVLQRFMNRAFRRPVEADEVDRYHRFWREVRGEFSTYEQGVRETLVAVLCSPSFLYLDRPARADQPAEADLPAHQLTTNLSYFLWNSPPDEWLSNLAEQGKLRGQLADVVQRMLQDSKASRFTQTFAEEWLRLDRHQAMKIDAQAFPDYSRFVKQDMRQETLRFFHHALVENMSARVLVDSEFAMLNQNLAEFYGVPGVRGAEFRPVAVDAKLGRGGLLSQGAFLAGHSDGSQSHPIKRAVWLKERILGQPPPPPPPNVPELDPETPGFDKMTLKEQLELHRNKASCVDCHRKIDPYGVVFEQYDAVGRLRTKAKGKPIDCASELPDGAKLEGVAELKQYVLQQQYDAFLRSVCEHLFAYATGREITYIEQPEIDRLVALAREDDRLGSIVLAVVQSDMFLNKPATDGSH